MPRSDQGVAFACVKHLSDLCKSKQFDEALVVACSVNQQGIPVPREAIYSLLQGYSGKKDLTSAKKIHALMRSNKLDRISVLADHLIRLFVSCGCLEEADHVFSRVPKPSVYTWNAILTAHSKLGNIEVAIHLFHQMRRSGLKPDRITLLCMLKACSNAAAVGKGRLIHHEIFRGAFSLDMILGSALVDMYAKCGSLEDAQKIFDELPSRDAVAWGAMLAGYAQHGHGFIAIQLFEAMQVEGVILNEFISSSVLKACETVAAIEEGRILHSQIVESGLDLDVVVGSSIVDMYSKCRSIEDAQKSFQNLSCRDSILWGTMVAGYTLCGQDQLALDTFGNMLLEDIVPSKPMLLCVLKAASSLRDTPQGRVLHDLLIRIGLERELMLANALIDMYAKCAVLDEAQRVFDHMQKRDVVSWAALMTGYVECGDCESAISLFLEMEEGGISLDRVVILSMIKACAGSGNIAQGRAIHNKIDKWGLVLDSVLCNAFIDMYSKCGSLEEARIVFDESKGRDEVSWGSIISGYVNNGNGQAALELLNQMLVEGLELGKVVLLSSIKACTTARVILEGRFLHDQVMRSGLMLDLDIGCALINMYAKCDSLEDATKVFNELPSRDIIAWMSIILAYAQHGHDTFAVELFEKMQDEGIDFNISILHCIMKACGGINDITQGRLMHYQILKSGLESDVSVANLLISMYAKCQSLKEAHHVFDALRHPDEISWGTIIAGYIHDGHDPMPLDLFRNHEGLTFGKEMLVCILKACSSTCFLGLGRIVHFLVVETGSETDMVIGSSVIHMYARCRSLHDAFGVFDRLPAQDLVTYSTMIAGLVECDMCIPALELYMILQHEGLKADRYVHLCMLKICGTSNFIQHGRQIHDEIVRDSLDSDANVRSALVDMYANSASLEEAQKVFGPVSNSNTMLWGAIIAGYSRHGDCKRALQCLEDMERAHVHPTVRLFSSALAACSHAGSLDEGHQCFKSMTETYNILPRVEHLNCMIDLFVRAGCLELASDFLTAIPTCPDVVGWRSLLAGCRAYGNTEMGNHCFDQVVRLEPDDASGFTLMSGIWVEACRDNAEKFQAWRSSACKLPLLEVNTLFDDSSGNKMFYSQNVGGYTKLRSSILNREAEGFMPRSFQHQELMQRRHRVPS